jgi:hypothetical protein
MQTQPPYPPKGMTKAEIEYHAPKSLRIESYTQWGADNPDTGIRALVREVVFLITPSRKIPLETPPPNEGNPFGVVSFAVSPNQGFIFAIRKVVSGTSEMFLWVRQKNGTYTRHRETVGEWIVRRNRTPLPASRAQSINFIRLLEWKNSGNTVVLACDFTGDRKSPWHRVEIDLVRGKFSRYTPLLDDWKAII